jgi:hypothetical protein
MPTGVRDWPSGEIFVSGRKDAEPDTRRFAALGALLSSMVSTIVFHCPQPGQRPRNAGLAAPHC